MKAYSTTWCSF